MSLWDDTNQNEIKKSDTETNRVEKLKNHVSALNDPNYSVSSEIVFVAGLEYLRDQAFDYINTHFKDEYKLRGNVRQGFKNVQYFLTVPGILTNVSIFLCVYT